MPLVVNNEQPTGSAVLWKQAFVYYEIDVRHWFKPLRQLPPFYLWIFVLGFLWLGFGISLFRATVHVTTFNTFFHFVDCLSYGFLHAGFVIALRHFYLSSQFSNENDELRQDQNLWLWVVFGGVAPLTWLTSINEPAEIHEWLGVQSYKHIIPRAFWL